MSAATTRPAADEYASFYAGYVERVPDGDIVASLERQLAEMLELLTPLSQAQAAARPTPEDWNVLQVLGHITDAEQVFAYRALRIARGDQTPLAGFDQDDYVRAADFETRSLAVLLQAYAAQRRGSIALLQSFDDGAWLRSGVVSGHGCTARAWAWIMAGHELHHLADFRARYGIGA